METAFIENYCDWKREYYCLAIFPGVDRSSQSLWDYGPAPDSPDLLRQCGRDRRAVAQWVQHNQEDILKLNSAKQQRVICGYNRQSFLNNIGPDIPKAQIWCNCTDVVVGLSYLLLQGLVE